jgi:EAL domain-containing protein (putative c-di-GMP-specific phosphodiesterase class I)
MSGRGCANGRLLLVGTDLTWSSAVRMAAHEMGYAGVDAVRSGRAAVTRLLHPQAPYSYVLLNPHRDDGQLRTIRGLTCDEEQSGSELLVLGRSARTPRGFCVIAGPTRQAIRRALADGCDRGHPPKPSVATLRHALANRHIETRYQPVVRLADRKPVGVEALARLSLPWQRMIAPEHFVPRIEHAGLAAQLTDLVAGSCFADATGPHLQAHGFAVALNMPLDVMLQPAALRRLDAQREAAGLVASRVVIELTESQVANDLGPLSKAVQWLRTEGYQVAIDDVAPGMPGHKGLLDIPFSTMKIDRVVVRRAATTPHIAEFMKRIVGAAKARGMTVVVEGIRDPQHWNRARDAGADLAQGFGIARPMPKSVLSAWKDHWHARTDLG